jgi:hypothetical protein
MEQQSTPVAPDGGTPESGKPTASGPVPFEYTIELLGDDETYTSWEKCTTPAGHKALLPVKYPVRCSVCLEPATKAEKFSADPNYRRPLCDKHAAEKPDLHGIARVKLTALQEQRLRRSQPRLALHKVTQKPMSADIHRLEQIEKHEHHNPTVGLPKPPKHPRMTKNQMSIKAAAIRRFRSLYKASFEILSGRATSLGEEVLMTVEQLHKIAARAGALGAAEVRQANNLRRRKAQDVQKRSRLINYGLGR